MADAWTPWRKLKMKFKKWQDKDDVKENYNFHIAYYVKGLLKMFTNFYRLAYYTLPTPLSTLSIYTNRNQSRVAR